MEFQNGMTDEEKSLLALECETMGKSWSVGELYRPDMRQLTHTRLKILKDEIRQPYFIKLKKFLWDQGVKGPENSASNLRVYPARESVPPKSIRL